MTKAALFLLGALTFFIILLLVITPTHPQQGPLQPVPRPSTVTVTVSPTTSPPGDCAYGDDCHGGMYTTPTTTPVCPNGPQQRGCSWPDGLYNSPTTSSPPMADTPCYTKPYNEPGSCVTPTLEPDGTFLPCRQVPQPYWCQTPLSQQPEFSQTAMYGGFRGVSRDGERGYFVQRVGSP